MGAYIKVPGEERQMRRAFSVQFPECGAPPGFACRKQKDKGPCDSHKAQRELAYAQALAATDLNAPVQAHKPRTGAFICLHIHPQPHDVDLRHAA